jgi:hypothetical protein
MNQFDGFDWPGCALPDQDSHRTIVDIASHFGGVRRTVRRFVVYPYRIPRCCAATYFPEANVLVPVDHVAEKSDIPASKNVVITLEGAILRRSEIHTKETLWKRLFQIC